MRVVFMGTPDFAAASLEALINGGHTVEAVFTQPDKPAGRRRILTPPPVKELALKHGIRVYQPERLKNSNAGEIIKDLKADIVVVVAYGKILPSDVLNAAPLGCINVHASLLPEYRGAAPVQWAVLNGEKETGVSIMQMDEGLDTGDVLLVKKTEIGENETSGELFGRLSKIGADALLEALDLIKNKKARPEPQPSGDFFYARMIDKSMSPIDWSKSALEIHNLVRGLQPWPAALTTVNGKNLKVHKTILTDFENPARAGEVVKSDKRLIVSCGDGKCLEILEVQPDGKKRMTASAFLQGNKIEKGTILGEKL